MTGVRVEPDGVASGPIEFRNSAAVPMVVDAGTTFSTESGVAFALADAVTVPGADPTTGKPGAATGTMRAAKPGSGGNVKTGEIGGRLSNGVYYSNRMQATTGGTDKEFPVVVQADLDALRQQAQAAAPELVAGELAKESHAAFLPSTLTIATESDQFDHHAGDDATTVNLQATLTVQTMTYDRDAATATYEPALVHALSAEAPEGYAVAEDAIDIGTPKETQTGDRGARLEVAARANAAAVLDDAQRAALAAQLAGQVAAGGRGDPDAVAADRAVHGRLSSIVAARTRCRRARNASPSRRPNEPPAGRAIGLDVGERRVGVAIADELGLLASPLATIVRKRGDLGEIRDLAKTWGADRLIIGLPTGLSGREGPAGASVRVFAEQLGEMLLPGTTIEFWDERLSTVVAERTLRESGARRDKRRDRVDAVAAAVILQAISTRSGRARRERRTTRWRCAVVCVRRGGQHHRWRVAATPAQVGSGEGRAVRLARRRVVVVSPVRREADEKTGDRGHPKRSRGRGRRCAVGGGLSYDPARQHGWVSASRQHHADDWR